MKKDFLEAIELETSETDSTFASFLEKRLHKHGVFTLWGEIDYDICGLCSEFLLDAMLSGKKEVTLFICSPGGDEDATRGLLFAIELCKQSGMTVKGLGGGLIASAAFDIFSACSPGFRFCFEATMFMTHSSSGHVADRNMYKLQCKLDEWTYKQYTNIAPSTRKKFLNTGNWWFDPLEAVSYGVADAVLKVGDEIPTGPVHPTRKTAEQQKEEAEKDLD